MKKSTLIRTLSVFLCLVLLLAVPISAVGTVTVYVAGTNDFAAAWRVLELVNVERTKRGIAPLQMDSVLLDAAMQRGIELSVKYSHTRPNGTDGADIVAWRRIVGENIAAGQIDAEEVVADWMDSPGHRNNILSESFRSVGMGMFESGGVAYWVQLFDGGEPRAAEPSADSVSVVGAVDTNAELLSLFTRQKTDVMVQAGGGTFEIGDICLRNASWEYASVVLLKESLEYTVDDPSVATVQDGVITGVDIGATAVTVFVAGAPEASVVFNVTVTEEAPLPATPSVQVAGSTDMAAAWEVLDRINAERSAAKIAPLKMDRVLLDSALQRAAEIAFYYSYTRPDGSDCDTVVNWRRCFTENIATGHATPEEAVKGWMGASANKKEILDSNYSSAGVGVFTHNGKIFWVLQMDGGSVRAAERAEETTAQTIRVNVAEPYINLYTNSSAEISLEQNETYTFDDVWNRNVGWNYVSVHLLPEDLAGAVADPTVVRMVNGVLVPRAAGTTTVSVSIAGIPNVALEYTVNVAEKQARIATINGVDTEIVPGTTVELPAADAFYAQNRYGYRFTGWSCVNAADGTPVDCILNPQDLAASFVMPDADVVIRAEYLLVGDLDGDGSITSGDLLRLTRILAGAEKPHPAGDIDGDGGWNVGDLVNMRRYVAGTYTPNK